MALKSQLRSPAARGALLILVLGATFLGVSSCRGKAVRVDRVEKGAVLETLVVSGKVLARSKASLGAPVTGTVSEVLVDDGAPVKKGQLLLRMDETEAQAALGQARAAEEQARARLLQLRATAAPVAVEALAQARTRLEQAARQLARNKKLSSEGFVSETAVEDAQQAYDLAKSQLESAALQSRSAARGGGDDLLAEAALSQATAARVAAEARITQMRVSAPADGVVLDRVVEPGDVVQPAKVLFSLALTTPVEILVQPDERNLATLRPGLKARASADAFPDLSFPAEVYFVSPAVDAARGTVDVKLRVPDPPAYLRTDMTLSVEIETGRRVSALSIPLDSVRDAARDPWVLVVEGGKGARRPVKLGARGGGIAEVTSGLAAGDLVIRPAEKARPGDRVRPRLEPRS